MIVRLRCHRQQFSTIEQFLFQQYIPEEYKDIKIQLEIIEDGEIYRYVVSKVFNHNLIATD